MSELPCPLQQILSKNLMFLNNGVGRDATYSGEAAEAKIGVSAKTFNNMLKGRNISKIDNIEKVARLFRVEPWELLREDFIESRGSNDTFMDLSRAIHEGGPEATMAVLKRYLLELDRTEAGQVISEYIAESQP